MPSTCRAIWSALLFSPLPAATTSALAQDTPKEIVIGEERSIHSAILNEDRRILVGTPANYEQGDARYPVMFVLDGDAHFHHTTGLTKALAWNRFVPDLLVVAISNTDRTRDLTPPSRDPIAAQQMPTHGGAANFRSFVGDELIPWVDANYRTRPYRILVGHSFGGLFAIDTLLTRPELFNAYIAISPSLQWDDQHLVERADAFFDATKELNSTLFMTAGNEGNALLGGVRKLSGVLDEKAPHGFAWHFEHMPAESHGSVPMRSTYQGLEFVFADWTMRNAFDTYESYGLDAIDGFYAKRDKKYGFDGGFPNQTIAQLVQRLLVARRFDDAADVLSHYRGKLRPPLELLFRLANGFREQGKPGQAIEWYRQALEADAGNEAARNALAELGQNVAN